MKLKTEHEVSFVKRVDNPLWDLLAEEHLDLAIFIIYW